MSIIFNHVCINEEMLPKYTHTHTHTHIYIYIYIYIYISIPVSIIINVSKLYIYIKINTYTLNSITNIDTTDDCEIMLSGWCKISKISIPGWGI